MKLAVIGSRTFDNYELLFKVLSNYVAYTNFSLDEIVSGGAKGTDSLAAKYARETRIKLTEFIPDWDRYGKSAGPKRNAQIIQACDECVAFWDGLSPGTKSSINLCKKYNKPVHIYWI